MSATGTLAVVTGSAGLGDSLGSAAGTTGSGCEATVACSVAAGGRGSLEAVSAEGCSIGAFSTVASGSAEAASLEASGVSSPAKEGTIACGCSGKDAVISGMIGACLGTKVDGSGSEGRSLGGAADLSLAESPATGAGAAPPCNAPSGVALAAGSGSSWGWS